MHYANLLGRQRKKREARRALARCKAINAAMTPEHYATLIHKLSTSSRVAQARLGGLAAI
jgi:phage FluMu protein Com